MTSGQPIALSSIEARTIRKLQIRILPFIFLLYVIAYLDRINIGFAALTMNKELGITSQQFGMLVHVPDERKRGIVTLLDVPCSAEPGNRGPNPHASLRARFQLLQGFVDGLPVCFYQAIVLSQASHDRN